MLPILMAALPTNPDHCVRIRSCTFLCLTEWKHRFRSLATTLVHYEESIPRPPLWFGVHDAGEEGLRGACFSQCGTPYLWPLKIPAHL